MLVDDGLVFSKHQEGGGRSSTRFSGAPLTRRQRAGATLVGRAPAPASCAARSHGNPACGSSKNAATTSTTDTRTSPQQFVAAANQVCIRSDKRIFKSADYSRPEGLAANCERRTHGRGDIAPPARAEAFRRMLRFGNALALSIQEVHDSLVKSDIDSAAAAQFAAAQIQDRCTPLRKRQG